MHNKTHFLILPILGGILFAFLNGAFAFEAGTNGLMTGLFTITNADGYINSEAQYQIGLNYAEGIGVAKDYEKAARWYQAAANNGNVHGQFAMGIIYGRGHGVAKDLNKSFQWFCVAATNGSSEAMTLTGYYYYWGIGTQRDFTNAFYWYEKGAKFENVRAQVALAMYYYMISNRYEEQKHGFDLLISAANHWYPQAQYFLACYYGKGIHVKKDPVEAYKWAYLASSYGYVNAKSLCSVIAAEEGVESKQVAEAMRRAKYFAITNVVQSENVHLPDIIDMNSFSDFIRNKNGKQP